MGNELRVPIAPTSRSHGFGSETGLVTVTASSSNCVWSVSNSHSWISFSTLTNGTNSGSFGYTVTANTHSSPRTASFTVGGETFTLTQAGAPCNLALTPANRGHGAGSETGLVAVTVVGGCTWSVGNSNTWIAITAGASGVGSGSFGYSIDRQPNRLRSNGHCHRGRPAFHGYSIGRLLAATR